MIDTRAALLRRLDRTTVAHGSMTLPAAPAFRDDLLERVLTQFRSVGRGPTDNEREALRDLLGESLLSAYTESPYSQVCVSWETDAFPAVSLTWTVTTLPSSMESEYEKWVATREPPLFGSHPDARVLEHATRAGSAADCPVLDVGAGTGRNTFPLARRGHPTDVVEMTPALLKILRAEADAEGLSVRIFEGDALDSTVVLPTGHYALIVLCEVVTHFRSIDEFRRLMLRLAPALRPGGQVLLSAFVWDDNYEPDDLAHEVSQIFWSIGYSRDEIRTALAGSELLWTHDVSVYDYERAHLPAEAWPPTGWFSSWTRGQDAFDLGPKESPLSLRWLTFTLPG